MTRTIQKLLPDQLNQLAALIGVFERVFGEDFTQPSSAYRHQLLANPTVWVFAALIDETVVGGLTAYVLPSCSSEQPLIYLYDLAVETAYQRQGIGRQLVTTLTEYAHRVGAREVFVQADATDTGAIAFYQATGGQAQPVMQFTYSSRL